MGQVSRIIIHGTLQSIVDLSQLGWRLEQRRQVIIDIMIFVLEMNDIADFDVLVKDVYEMLSENGVFEFMEVTK